MRYDLIAEIRRYCRVPAPPLWPRCHGAQLIFKQVNFANEVLTNEAKRRQYDAGSAPLSELISGFWEQLAARMQGRSVVRGEAMRGRPLPRSWVSPRALWKGGGRGCRGMCPLVARYIVGKWLARERPLETGLLSSIVGATGLAGGFGATTWSTALSRVESLPSGSGRCCVSGIWTSRGRRFLCVI